MPRRALEIETPLEFLSILDADGRLDGELEPELDDATLQRMHRQMLLARRFDARMLSLQRQGRIGTFAPVKGQEAAQVGAAAALEDDDWIVPSYREIAVNIWRELPLEGMLIYNAGYNEGGHVPEHQRQLPPAVPVGTQMLQAVGIAYATRLAETSRVALTFFGDGATSTGDFHEAMNFAAVFRCPVVFLCQNNQWAISVPRERQSASPTLAQKGLAYGMPALQVDGNDVLAVYAATSEAVARARERGTPTLIEAVTYRLGVHTTVDDPSKYRDEQEVEAWRERDPIPRFQRYLEDKELLDEESLQELEGEIEQEIDEAVKAWEKAVEEAAGPELMFEHLFAEPPPPLRRQREAFEREHQARRRAPARQGAEHEGARSPSGSREEDA